MKDWFTVGFTKEWNAIYLIFKNTFTVFILLLVKLIKNWLENKEECAVYSFYLYVLCIKLILNMYSFNFHQHFVIDIWQDSKLFMIH